MRSVPTRFMTSKTQTELLLRDAKNLLVARPTPKNVPAIRRNAHTNAVNRISQDVVRNAG